MVEELSRAVDLKFKHTKQVPRELIDLSILESQMPSSSVSRQNGAAEIRSPIKSECATDAGPTL